MDCHAADNIQLLAVSVVEKIERLKLALAWDRIDFAKEIFISDDVAWPVRSAFPIYFFRCCLFHRFIHAMLYICFIASSLLDECQLRAQTKVDVVHFVNSFT